MPKKKTLDPFSVNNVRYCKEADIAKPYLFRYPNDKGIRRKIDVDINSWRGVSLGATHYYAKLSVEQNAIWDPKELVWTVIEDMAECKKFNYRADVATKQEAVRFVDCIIKEFFSATEQYLIEDDIYEEKWVDMKKRILDGD